MCNTSSYIYTPVHYSHGHSQPPIVLGPTRRSPCLTRQETGESDFLGGRGRWSPDLGERPR